MKIIWSESVVDGRFYNDRIKEQIRQSVKAMEELMSTSDILELTLNGKWNTKVLQGIREEITKYNYSYNTGYLENGNILLWKNKAKNYVDQNFTFDTVIYG